VARKKGNESRSADEVPIHVLLYTRYDSHRREIEMFHALPPEQRKLAIRKGIRLEYLFSTFPHDIQAFLHNALFESLPLQNRNLHVVTPSQTPQPASQPCAKFDLFAHDEDI